MTGKASYGACYLLSAPHACERSRSARFRRVASATGPESRHMVCRISILEPAVNTYLPVSLAWFAPVSVINC
jgi:hypothetical protein